VAELTEKQTGGPKEWIYPSAFLICAGWVVWHIPAFILDWFRPENESLFRQISELHLRKSVLPELGGLFGGFANIVDWTALILIPVFAILGARSVVVAPMEFERWQRWDRFGLFIGRATMMMILAMTCVMLFEVFMRYAVERPTKWANELTLWIAGFVFLCSGFYAMQQRCHIRISILYDVVPRLVRKLFDVLSVLMIVTFTFGLVFGSYKQVFINKLYRWEMFGTAFDPPIPATIQPMILIILMLISLQAIANLIADWDLDPEFHAHDEIDEEEIAAIKRSIGVE
jgi:TRAP-type mannitol/chloroaromatic compound transport system permease small subunit